MLLLCVLNKLLKRCLPIRDKITRVVFHIMLHACKNRNYIPEHYYHDQSAHAKPAVGGGGRRLAASREQSTVTVGFLARTTAPRRASALHHHDNLEG